MLNRTRRYLFYLVIRFGKNMLTHSSVQKCWITNNDDLIVATNRRRSYSSSEDSMLEFILKKKTANYLKNA